MSLGSPESLWSYELSRTNKTKRLLAASSSGDSDPSPGTSVRAEAPQVSATPRPSIQPRDTYEQRNSHRITIKTIEEGRERRPSVSIQPELSDTNETGSVETVHTVIKPNIYSSTLLPKASQHELLSQPHRSACSSPGNIRKNKRPAWTRTRSGSVWYKQQKQTSLHNCQSVRSFRSDGTASDNSDLNPQVIVPLKPPQLQKVSHTSFAHHVTVDTPFEEGANEQHTLNTSQASSTKNSPSRRSTDVRRLFSVSSFAIRNRFKGKSSEAFNYSSACSKTSESPTGVQGHKSLLKREQTATVLGRVSAILENCKRLAKNQTRTLTQRSSWSMSSLEKFESSYTAGQILRSKSNILRRDSPSNLASMTSSILGLRMGSTPHNSPSEMATYKVKRSPSAETEVFLKIDISIRGQTSYLPSEARRVHTPPLPHNNTSGDTKKFYFDHYQPSPNDIHEQSTALLRSNCFPLASITEHRHVQHRARSLDMVNVPLQSLSTKKDDKITMNSKMVKIKKEGRCDNKIANIDNDSSERNAIASLPGPDKHSWGGQETFILSDSKSQRYESKLDYTIPEHLPNSPLCPRNPRYWRVVKNKGSQFRGCWMHGYGEYDVVADW